MESNRLIEQILDLIRRNFRSDDSSGSMTAASIGSLVRRQLGAPTQMSDYPKLKTLLEELERQGAVKTGPNSKGAFSVWLLDPSGMPITPSNGNRRPSERHRPLRKLLWHAFVSTAPQGRRFMNRFSGEVRIGAAAPPDPVEEWVEIFPLPESEDRAAAADFLKGEGIPTEGSVSTALAAPRWFAELPRVIPPHLASAWKRRRTEKVVGLAEQWRRENHLPEQIVYDDRRQHTRGVAIIKDRQELRTHLLSAIQRMATDELLSLPIPARYMVSELRPELGSG